MKLVGYLNWFRPFIRNLSARISNFTDKLKNKENIMNFTEEDKQTLITITNEIVKQTILEYPDFNKDFTLQCDASEKGYGAVLYQDNKLIGIFSGKFTEVQSKYDVMEREFLGILKALMHFERITFQNHITIITDNKNLLYDSPATNSRTQRWKICLSRFNHTFKYMKGENNIIPDSLSRLSAIRPIKDHILDQIKQAQKLYLYPNTDKYILKDGYLFDPNKRLIIPKECAKNICYNIHKNFGHPGSSQLYYTLKNVFKIDSIKDCVKSICDNCISCNKNKSNKHKYGKTSGGITSTAPFKRLSSDIFGPISTKNYDYPKGINKIWILTITDLFSRYTKLYVIEDLTSESLTKSLNQWIKKYGVPDSILSDRGKQYASRKYFKFLSEHKIRHKHTSGYNPTGNSISERINRTLVEIFRIYKNEKISKIIHVAEHKMNILYHKTIKASPFELLNKYNYFDVLKTQTDKSEQAIHEINEQQKANEHKTNMKRINFTYKNGDMAFIKRVQYNKLDSLYDGPFLICDTKNCGNLVLLKVGRKNIWVNIKRLKPYRG